MPPFSARIHRLPRIFALCAFAALLLVPTATVHAHPADMYSQNQSVTLSTDALLIDWQILPGPFLADAVWAVADTDQDGSISAGEAQAWVAPFISSLSVELDGQALAPAGLQTVQWPATVDVLRTGEGRIEIGLRFTWPANTIGPHTLVIHSAHLEANSLNWFSVLATSDLSFDQPAQDNGLLSTNVHFAGGAAPTSSAGMKSWNSGTPNLPAFGAAITKLSGGLAAAAQPSVPATANASSVASTLTALVKTQQFSPWFLAGAFLLSLALGSLHALTPGHGKALVGAYLVGSHGSTRDAIVLGSIVTVTHTGSVVLLGLVTLLASHYILPALIAPWLEIISGVLVIGFGLNLLFRRRGDLAAWIGRRNSPPQAERPSGPSLDHHVHEHTHGNPGSSTHTHDGDSPHVHDHGGHFHQHHTHELPAEDAGDLPPPAVTIRSLLALGISGGLVPCPDAIAILLVAVAVNRVPFGILLIISFSIGLALVLIAIGIAMVKGLGLITRSDMLTRFAVYTPVLSAVVVTGLGAALTVSALNSLKFGAAVAETVAGQPSSSRQINSSATPTSGAGLLAARLLYIASDLAGADQLFMLPLSGGQPIQYTDEPSGITGYAISPDARTILYTLFRAEGGTAIWAINADGSSRRSVLDCPQSECNTPRWYPDGTKIAYDRLDDAAQATVPRFSVWWLDLATGETQPVFPDPSFASYAPQFSPDGKWLSYISTADNTLILFSLQDGRSHSIPLGLQAALPATWSPDGTAVLFASEAADDTHLRVKAYSLAGAQTTDLGGPADATDFSAAWSPDGRWIAIDRNISTSSSSSSNQVWLVKPDGSQAHAFLMEEGASYSSLLWSADGRFLLYSRYVLDLSSQDPGRFDIYAADTLTGDTRLLASGGDMPGLLP